MIEFLYWSLFSIALITQNLIVVPQVLAMEPMLFTIHRFFQVGHLLNTIVRGRYPEDPESLEKENDKQ